MLLWFVFAIITTASIAFVIHPLVKQNIQKPNGIYPGIIIAISLFTVVTSIALYAIIGDPFVGEMPIEERLKMSKDDALDDFLKQSQKRITQNPQNSETQKKIAPIYMDRGQKSKAIDTYKTVIAMTGGDPKLLTYYAENLTVMAGGIVTDVARVTFEAAVEKDPQLYKAKYFCALAEYQRGNISLAKKIWTDVSQNDHELSQWKKKAQEKLADLER